MYENNWTVARCAVGMADGFKVARDKKSHKLEKPRMNIVILLRFSVVVENQEGELLLYRSREGIY